MLLIDPQSETSMLTTLDLSTQAVEPGAKYLNVMVDPALYARSFQVPVGDTPVASVKTLLAVIIKSFVVEAVRCNTKEQ